MSTFLLLFELVHITFCLLFLSLLPPVAFIVGLNGLIGLILAQSGLIGLIGLIGLNWPKLA